jgi:hypothetical protein
MMLGPNPYWELQANNGGTAATRQLSFFANTGGAGTNVLTLLQSGAVGIGVTSPTQKLQITDGSLSNFYIAPGYDGGAGTTIGVGGGEYLAFNGAPFTTERMRIDSSGRLLVGTASSSAVVTALLQGNSSGSTSWGALNLARGTTSPNNGQSLGEISFSDSGHVAAGLIACQRDAGTWTSGTSQPTRLVFSTTPDGDNSPDPRMTITSGGTVIAGGGTAIDSGVVLSLQATSSEDAAEIKVRTNGQNGIQFRNASNADVGKITINASATVYATSSDYRLKENVIPLTGAADRLNQLQVHRFNFIADPDKTVDGFLAHEAQSVVPECVTGTKDEVDDEGNPVYQGIDQSKLVPLLTAALQEALAEIESLKARVTALEP